MPATPRRVTWDWATWTLALSIAAGLWLRAIGLDYGLPAIYNPDEVAIMNRTLSLTQTGLDPRNFLYPSLYFYALLAWEGLAFGVGLVTGTFPSAAAFEQSFFVDPSYIYLAGRWLSVACGAATIWGTFALATRLFDRRAAAVAAGIISVAPLAVRDAHYVKHDVPVTLLIVMTHLALMAWYRRPTLVRLFSTGMLAGLAMSTHYYAVFVAIPVAILVGASVGPADSLGGRIRRVGLLACAVVVAFALTSPFLLLHPVTALHDMVANREIVVDRVTESAGTFGSIGFYGRWLAQDALGIVAFLAALAGLVLVVRRGRTAALVTLAFPVAFMLFISNTYPASRYLNPVLPFAAILAGAAIASLSSMERPATLIAWGAMVAVVSEGATASYRIDRFFQQVDTRSLAFDWFERQVPPDTTVLIQPYSVPLRMSKAALAEALTANLGTVERATVKFKRQLALEPYPTPAYRTIFLGVGGVDADKIYVSPTAFGADATLAPLHALSVTHVVMKRYNVNDPAMAGLDAALEREGRLVARFSPYLDDAGTARPSVPPFLHNTDARVVPELERPGPIVEVWTIR